MSITSAEAENEIFNEVCFMKAKLCRVSLILILVMSMLVVYASALETNVDDDLMIVGYDDDIDYMQEMLRALEDGSEYAVCVAQIYEAQRNLKIDTLGLDIPKTDFFSGNKTVEQILEEIRAYIKSASASSGYSLTLEERKLVEAAVMAEAGGECYEGQMMIAQCILDGSLKQGVDVATFIKNSQIVTSEREPYESCKKAVSAVFDDGQRVTEEMADIWYAPALVYSEWHESQIYVTTIGAHKFFRKVS